MEHTNSKRFPDFVVQQGQSRVSYFLCGSFISCFFFFFNMIWNNVGKIVQAWCLIFDCAMINEKKCVLEIQVPKNISAVIVLIRGFYFPNIRKWHDESNNNFDILISRVNKSISHRTHEHSTVASAPSKICIAYGLSTDGDPLPELK